MKGGMISEEGFVYVFFFLQICLFEVKQRWHVWGSRFECLVTVLPVVLDFLWFPLFAGWSAPQIYPRRELPELMALNLPCVISFL